MKQHWIKQGVLAFGLVTTLSTGSLALAQPAQPATGPAKGFEAKHAQMKAKRAVSLRKNVGLSEAKAKSVEAAFDKYDAKHFALKKSMHSAREKLAQLLKEDSNDNKAYEAALKQMRDAFEQLDDLRKAQMNDVTKLLTPKERAKLVMELGKMHHGFGRGHHKRGPKPLAKPQP